jgi:hypothetical protein
LKDSGILQLRKMGLLTRDFQTFIDLASGQSGQHKEKSETHLFNHGSLLNRNTA